MKHVAATLISGNCETAILPGVFYVRQTQFFYVLWGGLTVLLGLELCLTRHRGMLLPFGLMQMIGITFPGMRIYERVYSVNNGNLFTGWHYNPDKYVSFGQGSWGIIVWAVILVALYIAVCFVGIDRKKTEESTAIGDL